ncbi:MAG: argininosuccinate lyase [Brevinematales bacterium]|nr:argininosuccinate lyase [Brevinematales bacterium]
MKLWQKSNTPILSIVEEFEVGKDYIYDSKLATYDVKGTLAHVKMLNKIGILTDDETRKVVLELESLLKKFEKSPPQLKIEDEDIHTYIENYITSVLGDVGKKIHTGRSRNDQVLTAIRLYEKDKLNQIIEKIDMVINRIIDLSKKYKGKPFIGYTHLRQAMPITVDFWLSSFIEAFEDDRKFIKYVYDFIDRNPLGSSAGYGVPITLDREYTTKLLEFSDYIRNPLYCQNTRGKYESMVVFSLVVLLSDVSRFSNDIILYSSDEFGFIKLSDEITTGSSIMPHKKNPDVFELMRAKPKKLLGYLVSAISIVSSLVSGYSKDLQETKEFVIESLEETIKVLEVLYEVLDYLHIDEEGVFSKMKKDIFSVHISFWVMNKFKIPFRDAYRKVGSLIQSYNEARDKSLFELQLKDDEIGLEVANILRMSVKELYCMFVK